MDRKSRTLRVVVIGCIFSVLMVGIFYLAVQKRQRPATGLASAGSTQVDQKSAVLEIDPETARLHEIAPHRHLLHAAEIKEGSAQLQLRFSVSPKGTVEHITASSPDGAMMYWPRLQKEVQAW